jgi:hypothetical protein
MAVAILGPGSGGTPDLVTAPGPVLSSEATAGEGAAEGTGSGSGEGSGEGSGSQQGDWQPPKETIQTQRYLKVRKQTGQPLTVYVQFRTTSDQGQEAWYPAAPGASAAPLKFEIDAGAEGVLEYEGSPITASRARIWAESATGQWLKYKDQDAVLVPQPYRADTLATHTHTFSH